MDAIKKILDIARGEIGTTELPGENVKYNTEYYGGRVNNPNLHWCAVFVWWLFRHAGMADLYFGGLETASCTTLYNYHAGQKVTDYQPGDIIFYNFAGGKTLKHVGICESYNEKTITTIEGNTGSGNQANGDGVYRKVRQKSQIVAAYRPRYDIYNNKEMEEFEMNAENIAAIRKIVAEEMDKRFPVYKSVAEVPEWGRPAVQRMIDQGYVKGDGAGKLHITPDYLLAIITQDRAMEVAGHGETI
jgi:Cell wall-associated hydrolases (invasion-associated proteins)